MKFIPSRELRIRPARVWKDLAAERRVVVTSNGKPVAMMVPVDEESLERTWRTLDRLEALENLRAMQEDAMARGLSYSMEEIDEIIKKARKERKARSK